MTSPGVATTTTLSSSSFSPPLAAIRAQVTCRGTTIRFLPFSLSWRSSLYIVGFEKQSRTLIIASDQLLQFFHVHPVSLKDPEGGRRRDEGQHGGDEDPGQLPRVSRTQADEGLHAASSSAAAESAGPAAGPPPAARAYEAEGSSAEETEHSGEARGEVGDEDPGGHSWLPGAEEAAGCSGRGDEDPGRLSWFQDAEVAEAERILRNSFVRLGRNPAIGSEAWKGARDDFN